MTILCDCGHARGRHEDNGPCTASISASACKCDRWRLSPERFLLSSHACRGDVCPGAAEPPRDLRNLLAPLPEGLCRVCRHWYPVVGTTGVHGKRRPLVTPTLSDEQLEDVRHYRYPISKLTQRGESGVHYSVACGAKEMTIWTRYVEFSGCERSEFGPNRYADVAGGPVFVDAAREQERIAELALEVLKNGGSK